MKRTAVLLTASHIARYVGQVAVLIVVTWVGDPIDVGRLTLALAVTAPVFVVLNLGMRTLVLTHQRESRLGSYLAARAVSTIIALALSSLMLSWALDVEAWPIAVGVLAMKSSDAIFDLISAWLQRIHRTVTLLLLSLAAALTNAAGALVGALTWGALFAPLLGGGTLLIFTAVVALPVLLFAAGSWRAASPKEIGAIVRAGLPLGVSYGGVALLASIPQYLLTAQASLVDTGRFGIMFYLIVAAELIVNPVSQAWIQSRRQALLVAQRPVALALRDTGKYSLVLLPVMMAGALLGMFIWGPIFGDVYAPSLLETGVLAISMALIPAVFLGAGSLAIANRYRSTLLVITPALAVTGGLCLVLIPSLGVSGALIAYAAGLFVRAAVPFIVLARIEGPISNV